jgi:altronate hydrolase
MNHRVTKVHPDDNVLVALTNLEKGEKVSYNGTDYILTDAIPAKHKFVIQQLEPGDPITMYGVLVGKAQSIISKGGLISTSNVKHAASGFEVGDRKLSWPKPEVSKFQNKTFLGYHRADGKVGTANYWLVIPLVFCENRNLDVLREALVNELGYGRNQVNKVEVSKLIELYKSGKGVDDILNAEVGTQTQEAKKQRLFPNVDGIKFLNHDFSFNFEFASNSYSCWYFKGSPLRPLKTEY